MNRFLTSIGAHTVWSAPRDVKTLIVVRFVRLLGYGGTTFILASYLRSLGLSDSTTGLFMTATLLGDLAISFVLTYLGDRMGVRLTSAIGSVLMCVGGLVFAWSEDFWILLGASILGVINPSAHEIDPFKAIEESAIARLSTASTRNEIFAWWTMLGMLGTAGSNLITGWGLTTMQNSGVNKRDSYRVVFLMYAAMGLVKLLGSLALSKDVEVVPAEPKKGWEDPQEYDDARTEEPHEDASLLDPDATTPSPGYGTSTPPPPPKPHRLFTPTSFSFMWKLSLALFFDFVGSGLAQISWMTYFFQREYGVRDSVLGTATFAAGVISSVLNLASSPLARAIGQVPTMVVCHSVNSLSLLMVAVPGNGYVALGLFMFRIMTRELDNAPRQAFISERVRAGERTSAMGVVNIVKLVGSCLGLYLTGVFASVDRFWLAFVVAGGLKLVYNVLISMFFWRRGREARR